MFKNYKRQAVIVRPQDMAQAIADAMELVKVGVVQLAFLEGDEAAARLWLEETK